ncbi:sodium:solute symporter family protein [Streptomyces sp. NPDC005012]|uniref:sodium:solute symporter family protein n=1 Tax=Streptomyces sp. NPDC005012 TaxID=3154558 RepID=UPI0033B060EB
MAWPDWTALGGYFLLMLLIGFWSRRRIATVRDFFTGGGRLPWWLSGVSHHMSGYSAAVLVAYAAVAYSYGVTLYLWAFVPLALATAVGARLFAPRWHRLRAEYDVASPLEYLARRYNVPTQQALAWSGTLLKVLDLAAKWASAAVLLHVFTGLALSVGILVTALVTLVHCAVGGLWADVLTDFGQFVVQGVAALAMLWAVVDRIGGPGRLGAALEKLPEGHTDPLVGPYTAGFLTVYVVVKFFECNGGMWSLAQRYMATDSPRAARRSALLSAALHLVWPAIILFPAVLGPVVVPGLEKPEQVYGLMAQDLLPAGLVGLTVAGMLSHTMATASSDANAVSAVVVRDILPAVSRRARAFGPRTGLVAARVCTVVLVGASVVVALRAAALGGPLGIVVALAAAVMGPIAIPMLLGLLPAFRRCGPRAALVSWAGGLTGYLVVTYVVGSTDPTATVATPLLTSLALFAGLGILLPEPDADADEITAAIGPGGDDHGPGRRPASLVGTAG